MLDVQPGCVFNLESKKPAAWATWATWATHPLQVGTASDGAKVALRVAVAAGETTMEEIVLFQTLVMILSISGQFCEELEELFLHVLLNLKGAGAASCFFLDNFVLLAD